MDQAMNTMKMVQLSSQGYGRMLKRMEKEKSMTKRVF